jgi:hypothetical protein
MKEVLWIFCNMARIFIFMVRLVTFILVVRRFDVVCCVQGKKSEEAGGGGEGALVNVFRSLYVPFLMRRGVRASVMVIFFAWLCSSVAVSILFLFLGTKNTLTILEQQYARYRVSVSKTKENKSPLHGVGCILRHKSQS